MSEHDDINEDAEHDPRRISRRTAIKRGAIVGGTLAWATPVVMGFGKPAFAAQGASPGSHACCYCYNGAHDTPAPVNPGRGVAAECSVDGLPPTGPGSERFNNDQCENFCTSLGYQHHEYKSSPNPMNCSNAPGPGAGCHA